MSLRRTIFFLALLLIPLPLFAALEIQKTTVGLDGYVRTERWIPVLFEIRNSGPHFQGKVQIWKGNTVFEKSLDIGESARKRVELLYYHNNVYETVKYRILDLRGDVVAEANLDARMLNYRDNLLLVISASEYNHQFLNGQENPWGGKSFVVYYKPEDLFSEWMAYATADGIALGSVSPAQLLPSHWKAVAQYTASGGVLICSAATDITVLNDPLYKNHLPRIDPVLTLTSDGDFLQATWVKKTTEPFPRYEIPAQRIEARDCDRELILSSTGDTLVTSSPYYKGSITYFSFDYTRVPEELRTMFAHSWSRIVYPSTPAGDPALNQRFRQKLDENPRVQRDLYNIPGLRLPDLKWFALFFFIYICAVGPLQYLILKLLRKSSLLWISFPAIILLFSVASFGYTKYRQTGTGKITSVRVIEVFHGLQQQTVYQVYGAVLAESGTFHFQSTSESSYLRKTAFQSLNHQPEPFVLSEDLPRRLVGESMKRWTFRAYDAFDVQPSSLNVHVNFGVRSKVVYGKVTNGSKFDIEESFFMYDSRNSASFGTVKAGTSRSFEFELNSAQYPPFAEKHLRDLLHLYAASYSNPHFFFGQIRTSGEDFIINGRGHKTDSTTYIAVYADSPDAIVINPWILTTY